jgi:GNAT superfamily N-acetyltransferase
MIELREATRDDIPALYALYDSIGKKDDGYFEHAFEAGAIPVMAYEDGILAGFALLNWHPRYSLYRKLGIPEIQDLNVVPFLRRRGIARAIVEGCEARARAKGCELMGIAVGLTKDYGPAQIMYIKMGYVPDGNGATYDRQGVNANATYTLDDDFALMLVKPL